MSWGSEEIFDQAQIMLTQARNFLEQDMLSIS
jgi:hypothetical protein